ncbi:MAG: hypothetical protein ACK5RL_05010 [Acidimicrobiales bacterium]
MARWLIDGTNVFGSRPDGWWNNRPRAADSLTRTVAEWCRGHDDEVLVVFDQPVDDATVAQSGGNLRVVVAERRGRDAADDVIVGHVDSWQGDGGTAPPPSAPSRLVVVSSDKGLRARLPSWVELRSVGSFRRLIGY